MIASSTQLWAALDWTSLWAWFVAGGVLLLLLAWFLPFSRGAGRGRQRTVALGLGVALLGAAAWSGGGRIEELFSDRFQPEFLSGVMAGLLLIASLAIALPSGMQHNARRRILSGVLGLGGLLLLWGMIPRISPLTAEAGFAALGALTIGSAAATITSRSPVYSAIWFAVSLLGTAGLLLLQGAQFLSVATIAVYAGAIVVTFLFVLMLAQPEGHAYYDRVSWGTAPRFVGAITAVVMAMLIAAAVTRPDADLVTQRVADIASLQSVLDDELPTAKIRGLRREMRSEGQRVRVTIAISGDQRNTFDAQVTQLSERVVKALSVEPGAAAAPTVVFDVQDIQSVDHAAHLGALLFSRHLITIQAAGALLLAALVGAVAIASRTGPASTRITQTVNQGPTG